MSRIETAAPTFTVAPAAPLLPPCGNGWIRNC